MFSVNTKGLKFSLKLATVVYYFTKIGRNS